jgi:hypothetical protein
MIGVFAMFEKSNKIGSMTRFGSAWPGVRCLAKTRKGSPCQRPAKLPAGRCRVHGGASCGPRTEEGRARQITHGRWTRAAKEAAKRRAEIGRAIRKELRTIERELIAEGLLAKAWRDQFDYRSCE